LPPCPEFPNYGSQLRFFFLLDLFKQNLTLPIFYSLIILPDTNASPCIQHSLDLVSRQQIFVKKSVAVLLNKGFLASANKISAQGQDSFTIDAHSLKIRFVPEIP
jgi:hypothetical protein